jgi:Protein of unknown function (DUF1499)
MGFVDDVEFWLDRTANVVHVRSASRLGKSDLGVNRKRVEQIRTKLAELLVGHERQPGYDRRRTACSEYSAHGF